MPAEHSDKKNELLADANNVGDVGTRAHEKLKLGILVACTEDLEGAVASLEASMNRNAESGDRLARKLLCLNVILTAATIVGAIATWRSIG